MSSENRKAVRYKEMGRVISQDLCAIPGILDDISATGCKVHFPCLITVDLENECELKISVSRTPNEPALKLMCKPQWVKEVSGTTQVGLEILYSPDASRLKDFIALLHEESSKDLEDDVLSQI